MTDKPMVAAHHVRLGSNAGQPMTRRDGLAKVTGTATYSLIVADGACKLEPGKSGTASCTITVDSAATILGMAQGEIKPEAAEVSALPDLTVPLDGKQADQVNRLVDLLDDHDDVKEVFSNAEFPA